MNQRKSARSVVTVVALTLAGALVACVGDEPTPAGGDDADAGGASSSGTSGSSGGTSGTSGGTSGSSGASGGTSGTSGASGSSDSGADAAVDSGPDALPPVTCSEDAAPTGAFNSRCRAAAGAYTPGGTILTGTYLLSSYYGCVGGAQYQIGWGTVLQENGQTYLRYTRIAKAAPGDVGTKYAGTVRLTAGAAGVIDALEECEAATKGTTRTGHYAQTAGSPSDLILDFAGEQLQLRKQ